VKNTEVFASHVKRDHSVSTEGNMLVRLGSRPLELDTAVAARVCVVQVLKKKSQHPGLNVENVPPSDQSMTTPSICSMQFLEIIKATTQVLCLGQSVQSSVSRTLQVLYVVSNVSRRMFAGIRSARYHVSHRGTPTVPSVETKYPSIL
jgi:hypothetical protein